MKFLLLLLATAFFVLGGDQAEAAPVIAAIGAISAAIAKIGIIGKLLIGVALSVGQSLLAKAMAKKNETKQPTGVDLSVSMGDDVPLSFTVGTYATGGKRKYIGTWGRDGDTPNAYLVDVIELENLPSAGLLALWAGDTKCTILWDQPHPSGLGFPVLEYRRGGNDYLWFKFADGNQIVADAYLREKFSNNSERPITADMIGRGCSYAILTCRYNSDLFTSGLPDWAFEMSPRKFYDLRKDSTNGGNGPQRWTEPSTWASTSNVAIIAYNIIRGISYGDEWVYGGQNVAAFRLPPSNWIAGANECDAAVELSNGTTEPAFRCGFEINVDREPLAVLEELEKAGNMRIAEVGGIFKVLVGAPGAAVYSFTDNDVIVTEGQSLAPFPSFNDTFNGIEATYPEPAEKWASKDAPARYDAGLEAEDDNNRLPAGIAYDAVPFANQVQRLMVAMIQDYRRFRVHQFYLPPDAYPLEPNDVVSWTSEHNGYAEKKFLVTAITGQRTFNRLGSFKEIDPSDNDWSSDLELPTTTGWIGKISPPAQIVAGWQVDPAIIQNSAGTSQRPSIKVSCAPDRDGVTHVWVKVRLASDKTVVFDSDAIPYSEPFAWKLNGTFTPKTDYEVSGEFVSDVNPNQQRSEWLPVTTPNALISTFDVFDNAITATKIADAAVSADKLMNEAVTALKLADQSVSTAKLQVAAVTAEIIANQSVDITKFASGLEPVSIVSSGTLPTVKTTTNINWQGELYTWNGTAYAKPQTGVADGSITAAKLANAAVTADKLANSAVTHDKIVAGAVYGNVIAAQSITARELILTDWSNIVDKGWSEGNLNGWTIRSLHSKGFNNSEGAASGYIVRTTSPGDQAYSARNSATPGDIYYLEVWAQSNGGTPAYLYMACFNANGAYIDNLYVAATALQNQWVKLSGRVTVPAGTAFVGMMLYSDTPNPIPNPGIAWSKPVMRRAASAELIVDGAITALKISAGAVTADAIAANAITTAKIMAGAVQAAQIAAGAITTEKLAVGLGKNWLSNSDFSAGMQGWGAEYVSAPAGTWDVSLRTDTYGVNPYGSLQLHYTGSDPSVVVGAWQRNADGTAKAFACVPGQWIEMSGRFLGHRTTVLQCYMQFVDQAGTLVQYALPGIFGAQQNTDPGQRLANYAPFFCKVQVPPGATQVRPFWRMGGVVNGQQDAYVWLKNLFVGLATANQTEASQWSDGGITVIGPGNISTGAILADKIGALAVTAGKIAANAVTATEIAANAITAAKIMAGSVTGDKLVANTITTRELILTDYTNLIPNGDFASGDLAATLDMRKQQATDNIAFLTGGFTLNGNRSLLLQKIVSSGIVHAVSALLPAGDVYIPIEGGAVYAVETSVWSNVGNAAGGFYVVIYYYGADKGYLSEAYPIDSKPVFFQRTNYKGKVTTPAGARFAKIAIYNNDQNTTTDNFIVDYIYMRKANAASLIVDGSITAAHIAANSITADKLQVTSLAAISANLGIVNIENAIIGNLQVESSNIRSGIVRNFTSSPVGGLNVAAGTNWGYSGVLTVNHGADSPLLDVLAMGTGQSFGGSSSGFYSTLNTLQDGNIGSQGVGGSVGTIALGTTFRPPAGRTQTSFRVGGRKISSGDGTPIFESLSIRVLEIKFA